MSQLKPVLDALAEVPNTVLNPATYPIVDSRVRNLLDHAHEDPRVTQLPTAAQFAVRQAIKAVESELPSLSVVASWTAVMETIHEVLWRDLFLKFNATAASKKRATSRESIREFYDFDLVDHLHKSGLITLPRFRALQGLLNERNHEGHAAVSSTTSVFAAAYIERAVVQATHVFSLTYP